MIPEEKKHKKTESRKKWKVSIRFGRMQMVLAAFMALFAVVYLNQRNITYEARERMIGLLDQEEEETTAETEAEGVTTLLLGEEGDASSQSGCEQMEAILSQMRVGYELCMEQDFQVEDLEKYDKVGLSVTHLDLLGERLLDLMDWAREGGNVMLLYPPESGGLLQMVADDFGIAMLGDEMARVEGLHFKEAFMPGGGLRDFLITDPYDSSLAVRLTEDCRVYLESSGEYAVPIIWRREIGEGTVVVDNLGFLEKTYRGIHCAAYTLLGDTCVYPVINGAAFYIDDFPSPVPGGEGKYISRDFGMDVSTFYTQVWWKDTQNLAEKYGIRYTGMVIEQYSDQVERPYERNHDVTRYQYFGNMLLDGGGEIGLHGYNHMPLCLKNFDYQGQFDSYKRWNSYEDMKAGLTELIDFCGEIFPKEKVQTYVPPSNILSEEGRAMLSEDFPEIKSIASVYLPGDMAYEQEFGVAEDGIVETPRVIAGYIMDDYTRMAALCEMNLHFVSSHFQHPDDVLDEDRGAAMGWEKMHENLSDYVDWLYTAAPNIRNLTGTEMAGAVQRYDRLRVEREESPGHLNLKLDGLVDEAYLLVRINTGTPGKVSGGSLTKQAEGLYLLKAEKPEIDIEIK